MKRIRVAVPKGRLQCDVLEVFKRAGLDVPTEEELSSRRLVFAKKDIEWIFVKDGDVPVYVEFGAADAGVAGFDQVLEQEPNVFQPVEFPFGRCRMMLIRTEAAPAIDKCPVIATKYPRLTRAFLRSRGLNADVIALQGSVELAAVLNLSPWIVDLVESGETARIHGLILHEEIAAISPRLLVNRNSIRLEKAAMSAFIESIENALRGVPA
jgi:ATP phosphoribosyltransferase